MSVGLREVAARLGVSERRVRALIANDRLAAEKVGGRWLVEPDSVERLAGGARRAGPPWSPVVAWAYLLHVDGERGALAPVAPRSRDRVRARAAAPPGLDELAALAARRAEVWRCHAHRSVVAELAAAGVATGLAAAETHRAGLAVRGDEPAEVYLPHQRARRLADELALTPAPAGAATAVVRAVPDGAWLLDGWAVAPALAVALDLAERGDPRSREAAEALAGRAGRRATAGG